ncbi:uncharacterized protein si:ch211-191i18.4 [Osmerus eperlanus]|uniref:uncharacterized protein si:ch211-191i18.4 n=1 Tax=Osmerus eperlanus TaxID=29151 RepID=UPI002E162634
MFTMMFLIMNSILLVNFLSRGVETSLPEPVPSSQTRPNPREHELPLGIPVHDTRNGSLHRRPWAELRENFNRLPGVCRRLRRRRITILCNMGKFCTGLREIRHGQVCRCPRGSRCSHFFLRSL